MDSLNSEITNSLYRAFFLFYSAAMKKELFLKIIYPLKFPDLAEEFHVVSGGGFILYGPPGNGNIHEL